HIDFVSVLSVTVRRFTERTVQLPSADSGPQALPSALGHRSSRVTGLGGPAVVAWTAAPGSAPLEKGTHAWTNRPKYLPRLAVHGLVRLLCRCCSCWSGRSFSSKPWQRCGCGPGGNPARVSFRLSQALGSWSPDPPS